ncbi:MAG TPA: TIGR02281 family clan AA aspartic protease [Stellaceae bacterium]|jgi:aspartyl protease family protein
MSDAYGPSGGKMLRRAFFLLIGCGAAAYRFPNYLSDMGLDFGSAASVPATPAPPKPHSVSIPDAEPPATQTYQAQHGNQFYVTATVNGNSINFLVDTGATRVALTQEDATRLGFDLNKLNWNVMVQTANGVTRNAPVTLGDIRLSRIVQYNVPALVMRQSGISLLGMSFLSRLRSWQISNGVLTIAS